MQDTRVSAIRDELIPDLVIEQAYGYHISGDIGGKQVFGVSRVWIMENEETGIVLAHGPSFEGGKNLGTVKIYYVTPTILYLWTHEESFAQQRRVNGSIWSLVCV